MSKRVGIELSPLACRIVDLDAGAGAPSTRVHEFARLPRMGSETHAGLAALRGRDVAVVAWGLRSRHRQVDVSYGSYGQMRREAVSVAREGGVDTRGMIVDIAAAPHERDASRGPVLMALADAEEFRTILQPLRRMGIRVRSIVTPTLALMSLARLHREYYGAAEFGLSEAYIALAETSTTLALVQGGLLVAGRELAWGYQNEIDEIRPRDEIAARLARELDGFFQLFGFSRAAVAQVLMCGGLPELRNMAIALMERLDIEVEPLDSLFGIDETALPEPADEFRERSAEFRLAWAAAADWRAPINLLRGLERRQTRTTLAAAAVAAGVVAGPLLLWSIFRSSQTQTPTNRTVATTSIPARPTSTTTTIPSSPERQNVPSRPAASSPLPERPITSQAERAQTGVGQLPANQARRRSGAQEAALPFDAELGTILYAAERRLAIIDGQIVEVGDDVRGARVIEITPTGVMLRDAQGRLRRLALTTPGK